ncbi:MAG: hypothetical protein G01um10147_1101 [Microgenomates group bacterium Gr01-1014_7]|nr:MAG: hypothetical protein G01um10147_1101 [Microgenomates group bacterium Gr01-1014_7]
MDKLKQFNNLTIKQLISLIILIILLIAIPATYYLVQNQQILKSKAYDRIYNGFEVRDSDGQYLNPRDVNNQAVYDTDSLDVTIRVNDLNTLLGN